MGPSVVPSKHKKGSDKQKATIEYTAKEFFIKFQTTGVPDSGVPATGVEFSGIVSVFIARPLPSKFSNKKHFPQRKPIFARQRSIEACCLIEAA